MAWRTIKVPRPAVNRDRVPALSLCGPQPDPSSSEPFSSHRSCQVSAGNPSS